MRLQCWLNYQSVEFTRSLNSRSQLLDLVVDIGLGFLKLDKHWMVLGNSDCRIKKQRSNKNWEWEYCYSIRSQLPLNIILKDGGVFLLHFTSYCMNLPSTMWSLHSQCMCLNYRNQSSGYNLPRVTQHSQRNIAGTLVCSEKPFSIPIEVLCSKPTYFMYNCWNSYYSEVVILLSHSRNTPELVKL